jgi:hypothetical protein
VCRLYDAAFEGPDSPLRELTCGWDPHGLRRRLEPVATWDAWRFPDCCASTPAVAHARGGLGSDLHIDAIRADLATYHDRALLAWLEQGFRTGALDQHGEARRFTFWPNHGSARGARESALLQAAVAEELRDGWVEHLGAAHDDASLEALLRPLGFTWGTVAPLATIPKGDGVRTIHDMSFPKVRRGKFSDAPLSANARVRVNAQMSQPGPRFLRAAPRRLRHLFPLEFLVAMKLDVVAAYRLLCYDGSEREMLLFSVGGQVYCYMRPSFGSRASAALFSRVMAALQWSIRERVARAVRELRGSDPALAEQLSRYESMSIIDDSLFLTTAGAAAILEAIILEQYERWGMPINEKKRRAEGEFGPIVTWAGVEHNLETDVHRLHGDKRTKWAAAVGAVRRAGYCSVAELRSLLGKLSFAADALTWGRAFLGHLGDVLTSASAANSQVARMSPGARRELAIWGQLLQMASPAPSLTRPTTRVVRRYMSDASTSTGLAGAWLDGFTLRVWHYVYSDKERAHIAAASRSSDGAHITRLEFLCFGISTQRWLGVGPAPDHLEFAGDNAASCAMLQAKTARTDKTCGEILLELARQCTTAGVTASSTWIPGELNTLLDLASRTDSTDTLHAILTNAFPDLQVVVEALDSSPLERFQGLRQAHTQR